MREIKFRAWWNDTGKKVEDFNNEYIIDACNDEVFTVEQFTGLHDKNGKEIYEGDVVRPGFGAVSVYFDGGRFCLYFLGDEYWNEYADKIEVIGNIHENPELLEVTK